MTNTSQITEVVKTKTSDYFTPINYQDGTTNIAYEYEDDSYDMLDDLQDNEIGNTKVHIDWKFKMVL